MRVSKNKNLTSSEFDRQFEAGDDVMPYLDSASAKVRYPVKRVSIDFPQNIIGAVDKEASKIGVNRTALIKMWVAEQLLKKKAINE